MSSASPPASSKEPHSLDLEPTRALFQGKIRGLVATLYAHERPLCGLAGLLDWRFHGQISAAIRAGAIGGKVGECAYLPLRGNDPRNLYHVFLVGAGSAPKAGLRQPLPAEVLEKLRRNLSQLKIDRVGISRSDLGGLSEKQAAEWMKEGYAWIVQ